MKFLARSCKIVHILGALGKIVHVLGASTCRKFCSDMKKNKWTNNQQMICQVPLTVSFIGTFDFSGLSFSIAEHYSKCASKSCLLYLKKHYSSFVRINEAVLIFHCWNIPSEEPYEYLPSVKYLETLVKILTKAIRKLQDSWQEFQDILHWGGIHMVHPMECFINGILAQLRWTEQEKSNAFSNTKDTISKHIWNSALQ